MGVIRRGKEREGSDALNRGGAAIVLCVSVVNRNASKHHVMGSRWQEVMRGTVKAPLQRSLRRGGRVTEGPSEGP